MAMTGSIMRRLIRLRRLPWGMKTEKEVRIALEESPFKEVMTKLRGVQFLRKASNRDEQAASALLEFEKDKDAALALKTIRKRGGLIIDGIDTKASAKIGPAFTLEGIADAEKRVEDELREDPLGDLVKGVEAASNEFPTLEQLRSAYVDEKTDQWDFFRNENLPGLQKQEWILDDLKKQTATEKIKDEPDKEPHPSEVLGRWAETIVKVDRVQKVVKGGTIVKYRALVAVGNLMGAGGFAYGKATSPQDAIAKASRKAKQNLFFVERFKGVALAHDVQGKHNSCIVNIFATPPGYGTKGSALGRTIMKQLGFASFTIKAHGRRSPASYVRLSSSLLIIVSSTGLRHL